MANEEMPSYIGRKSCGCIVYAIVDDPADAGDKAKRREMGRELEKLLRDGLTIERVTVGFVRACNFGCRCEEMPTRAEK
jgi:hypothetical protein